MAEVEAALATVSGYLPKEKATSQLYSRAHGRLTPQRSAGRLDRVPAHKPYRASRNAA